MTDKQIIIDCSYKGECQMMGCINDDTCFIKQLFEERNRAEKELYSKEQECEELKNFHINLVGVKECEIKELLKLKQTLAEIKNLIQSDYCTEIGSCEFCAEIGNCLNRKILQKINEVEDEKNM